MATSQPRRPQRCGCCCCNGEGSLTNPKDSFELGRGPWVPVLLVAVLPGTLGYLARPGRRRSLRLSSPLFGGRLVGQGARFADMGRLQPLGDG